MRVSRQTTNRKKLTARFVDTVKNPGKYYDGVLGLFVQVYSTGAKCWQQQITIDGKRTTLGLGGYPVVSLRRARKKALKNLRLVRKGKDPRVSRRRRTEPTFAEAAVVVLEVHRKNWSSAKLASDWIASLERYAFPRLERLRVSKVSSQDVIEVLLPIWTEKHRTALNVRQRIGLVMRWAIAQGYRVDDPTGRVLTGALPKVKRVTHFRALPHGEVARAIAKIRASSAWPFTRLVLEFLILTASRSQEARLAEWGEVDFVTSTWTQPPEHTKMRNEHVVPLSSSALAVLHKAATLAGGRKGLIFPSRKGGAIDVGVLSYVVKMLGINAVPHGFRSSFRDWSAEAEVDDNVAEACLAHEISNQVKGAYLRTKFLEQRRVVMEDWAWYLKSQDPKAGDAKPTSESNAQTGG